MNTFILIMVFLISTSFSMFSQGYYNDRNVAKFGTDMDYHTHKGGALLGAVSFGAFVTFIASLLL